MAKRKAAKKQRKRKLGPKRTLPKKARYFCGSALGMVRRAKVAMEKLAPNARKAWRELHNVESRLSRLV